MTKEPLVVCDHQSIIPHPLTSSCPNPRPVEASAPAAPPESQVEWVEPFGPNSEPVFCRVPVPTAIAYQRHSAKQAKPDFEYTSDEEALADFVTVHWATVSPAQPTDAAAEKAARATAWRILSTSNKWGAAYGACAKDYPDIVEAIGHRNPLLNRDCPHCSAEIPLDSQEIAASAPAAPPATKRQIVFNWLQGEDDLTQSGGWWGTSDEVEKVDKLLAALETAQSTAAPKDQTQAAIDEAVRVLLTDILELYPQTYRCEPLTDEKAHMDPKEWRAIRDRIEAILPILRSGK